jgi:hypothetical protein
MNADEAPGPLDTGLLGTDRAVVHTDGVSQRMQQAKRARVTWICCRTLDGVLSSTEPWVD